MVRIPTKEEIEARQWQDAYSHFNQRLQERYKISISFGEYKDLCRVKVEIIKKQSQNKAIGFIEIKGIKVKVGKEIARKRRLITALPFKAK
jgi:hypothetical protein